MLKMACYKSEKETGKVPEKHRKTSGKKQRKSGITGISEVLKTK
ncbi:hypothetical protein HMPREF9374_2570 [Desmospora sp. 8437]|nr:hypothetical protein HMPREF9374_2570 [Desmospora sp. 8437]